MFERAGFRRRVFYWGGSDMAKRQIPPEMLEEARRLYEQTLAPVDDIADMLGIGNSTFYLIVNRNGWRGRRAKLARGQFVRALSRIGADALIGPPADQPRAPVEPKPPAATAEQRLVLAQRLQEAVGDQIDAIKHVTKLVGAQEQLGEGARGLAAVSRSLRETHELLQPPEEEKKPDVPDDEPFPYDVEQFRRDLARALRAVLDERRGGAARESDAPVRQTAGPQSREAED